MMSELLTPALPVEAVKEYFIQYSEARHRCRPEQLANRS